MCHLSPDVAQRWLATGFTPEPVGFLFLGHGGLFFIGRQLPDPPIKAEAMPRVLTARPHCLVLAQNTPVCQGYLLGLTNPSAAPRHMRGPVALPFMTYGCVQC